MQYESIMEKLLDDDNDDLIVLQPDGGEKVSFEQVATIVYEDELYAILRPVQLKEDQVVIFKLDPDDEESLELVQDARLARNILEVYNEDVAKE